jgi:hypothetical protein
MTNYEVRFRWALERIASYDRLTWLRRNAARSYGLDYTEALEMAYENVIGEAKAALKGIRRKRSASPRADDAVDPHAADPGKPTPRDKSNFVALRTGSGS